MNTLLKALRNLLTPAKSANHTIKHRLRPRLELLEHRLVPAGVTFTVATELDTIGGPKMSLRDAISAANNNADPADQDIIRFAPSLAGKSIKLTSGNELLITQNVSIQGLGPNLLAIDGGAVNGAGGTRIFEIQSTQASIAGLTLKHGHASSDHGGAILNDGGSKLAVVNCTISGNNADDNGGGIATFAALTVQNCTVSGNTAHDGGGLYSGKYHGIGAKVTVQNSTIQGNTVTGIGGGIYNDAGLALKGGEFKLQSSTISGNTASGNGGGIYNNGSLTASNSTVSGNNTAHSGGAIENKYHAAATLNNCTVAFNNASQYGGGIENKYHSTATLNNCTVAYNKANQGGGLANRDTGIANLNNTIVSDNRNASGLNDLYNDSSTLNAQYSLIESPAGAINGTNSHNIFFASANLGPLRYNGGPQHYSGGVLVGLFTMLPSRTSKALRAGSLALVPPGMTTDERGAPRTYANTIDIGAVEASLDYRRSL